MKSASSPASFNSLLIMSISNRFVTAGESAGPPVRGSNDEMRRIVTSSLERIFSRLNKSCSCLSVTSTGERELILATKAQANQAKGS
jgi:hypothetical protein